MPSICKNWPCYINTLCFISALLQSFLFTQLASSGSATVNFDEGCNNIVGPVGLDMSPSHFNRQTCGGARAHYIIMLSGRLFILTSSSRTVTSSATVISSIGGGSWLFRANHQHRQMYKIQHSRSSLTRSYVLYPLQIPPPPPQTCPHQLLIQPISRAALFTRKLWSHPLTALPCLIVALPCGTHTAYSSPTQRTYLTTKSCLQHIYVVLHDHFILSCFVFSCYICPE